MYETLLGAILFYKKLVTTHMYEWEYIINPYNAYTWNKMVNDIQITVQFFIDGLHISCENSYLIEGLIKDLCDTFKTNFQELAVCQGKVHNYLGINIDYSNKNYVKFTIYDFIEDLIAEVYPDMNGRLKWPAIFKLLCGSIFKEAKHSWPKLLSLDDCKTPICFQKGVSEYTSSGSVPVHIG